MKKVILTIVFLLFTCQCHAAIVAAVSGGDWNTGSTWVGGVAPGAGDDVQIPATCLANITITSETANCNSLDCTGYTFGIVGGGAGILSVHGPTIILNSAFNFTDSPILCSYAGAIAFTSGGCANLVQINLLSTNAFLSLQDSLVSTNLRIDLSASSQGITTNNHTVTINGINDNGGASMTLGLGTSTVTLSGQPFNVGGDLDSVTGSHIIICTQSSAQWLLGNPTSGAWGDIRFTGGGAVGIASAVTFDKLSVTGTAVRTDSLALTNDITVTTALKLAGNSTINRLFVKSSTLGTHRTITLGASGTCKTTAGTAQTDFQDIYMSGGAANERDLSAITGLSGNCGGNSGITFTTTSALSWTTNSTGTWSVSTNWNGRVPLPQDTATINLDANGKTITIDMPRICSLTFLGTSATTLTVTFNSASITDYRFYGSIDLTGVTTLTATKPFYHEGRGSNTVNFAGLNWSGGSMNFQMITGTVTLTGAIANGISNWTLFSGTFDAATYNVTTGSSGGFNIATGATCHMGSGTWLHTHLTYAQWVCSATANLYCETSTIKFMKNSSYSATSFSGGGKTYNNVIFIAGGTGTNTISGANTFANLTLGGNKTYTWTKSITQTITGTLSQTGTGYNYLFDALNTKVVVNNDSSNNAIYGATAFSVEFLGTPTGVGENNYGAIVDKSNDSNSSINGWRFYYDFDKTWRFGIRDTVSLKDTVTTGTTAYGSLVHVVATWAGAGTAPKIYLDGVVSTYSANPVVNTPADDTNLTMIIGNLRTSDRTFNGTFQRVRIWRNIALTPTNVTTLYNGGTVAGATAEYLFTDGTGATLTDSSGAGNNGTITAGTGAWQQNMVWNTNTAGTQATIKGSGVVSVDYVDMRDNKGDISGGARYYAGTHSNSRSNNTNWNFTAPPALTGWTAFWMAGD